MMTSTNKQISITFVKLVHMPGRHVMLYINLLVFIMFFKLFESELTNTTSLIHKLIIRHIELTL